MKSSGSGEPFAAVFPESKYAYSGQALQKMRMPVMCNHCANPPCVRVCRFQATFQRPDGIVMMDYHRRIGTGFAWRPAPTGARGAVTGTPAVYCENQSEFSDAHQRRRGKMQFLRGSPKG